MSEPQDTATEPRRAVAAGWPRSLSLSAKALLPEAHLDEPSKCACQALIPPLGESQIFTFNCRPTATATSQEPSHLLLNKTQSSPTHPAPPGVPSATKDTTLNIQFLTLDIRLLYFPCPATTEACQIPLYVPQTLSLLSICTTPSPPHASNPHPLKPAFFLRILQWGLPRQPASTIFPQTPFPCLTIQVSQCSCDKDRDSICSQQDASPPPA